jgi:hypothetical protein
MKLNESGRSVIANMRESLYYRDPCDRVFAPAIGPADDEEVERELMKKISGGFDMMRSNICPECFCARSVNGYCSMRCET